MSENFIYDTAISVAPEYKNDILRHSKTWAEIDLCALKGNYRKITEHLKKNAPECDGVCILKADAYGHGANMCAKALASEGARIFGVSCIAEAIQLRSALRDFDGCEILILGYTLPEDYDLLIKYDITQTVFSAEYANALSGVASSRKSDKKLKVHIKLNTGMNRLGFANTDSDIENIKKICRNEYFSVEGIFTHFACADEPSCTMTKKQYDVYRDVVKKVGYDFKYRHVCNSPACVFDVDMHENLVRFGMLLYGCLSPDMPLDTKPVMKFCTTVSHIFTLKKGDTVSYGATYKAEEDRTVATLPIGYADGFIRAFEKSRVKIGGRSCPVIGHICMDQCMVDITGFENDIKIGDTVTIFGDEPEQIEALAKCAGTIPYEVLCLVGKRVSRAYRE